MQRFNPFFRKNFKLTHIQKRKPKPCKHSKKNAHKPFTQISQMSAFPIFAFHVPFPRISTYTYTLNFEHKLERVNTSLCLSATVYTKSQSHTYIFKRGT